MSSVIPPNRITRGETSEYEITRRSARLQRKNVRGFQQETGLHQKAVREEN